MSIKTEIDDSKHFWALYDVLSFIVICKEEKVSKQRIYGVVKFENYEPCTVFETDNLDDAFMFVFEIDESELKRKKKIQKTQKRNAETL
jgi:hypothetical protein